MNNVYLLAAAAGVRTVIVLFALLVGIRLAGRRHIGEMSADDVLLILMMSNAVQNAMTSGSGQLAVAIACAGILIVAGWLAGVAFLRLPLLETRVSGNPVILVHDGLPVAANLRREQLSHAHLMMAVRKQGLARIADVKLAVLETNGSISVVPREERTE